MMDRDKLVIAKCFALLMAAIQDVCVLSDKDMVTIRTNVHMNKLLKVLAEWGEE